MPVAIPSSQFFEENKYGKSLTAGHHTCKAVDVRANYHKDDVYRDNPRIIIKYQNENLESSDLWLKSDNSGNFMWFQVKEAYNLTWQEFEKGEDFAKWLGDEIIGVPVDLEVVASGQYMNIKTIKPVGGGGQATPPAEQRKVTPEAPKAGKGRW